MQPFSDVCDASAVGACSSIVWQAVRSQSRIRKHFRKPSFDQKRNRLYPFKRKEYKNKNTKNIRFFIMEKIKSINKKAIQHRVG